MLLKEILLNLVIVLILPFMLILRMEDAGLVNIFSNLKQLSLPGSLHEVHGNQGFSLLLCVDSPVLLAGAAVFLPYRYPGCEVW